MPNSSKLETRVRARLRDEGYTFEVNCSDLLGSPDIVFREFRVAMFVDGCFWHRHIGCPSAQLPRTQTLKWLAHFNEVVARDERVSTKLESDGWTVIRLWECQIEYDASIAGSRLRDLGWGSPSCLLKQDQDV